MIVRFFGHSCFLFYSKKGSRILTDPFSEKLKYFFPPLSCDIITVSHEHQNHSAVWRVYGRPYVVKRISPGPCEFDIPVPLSGETFLFKGLPTHHDEFSGRKRGPNTVFVWGMDGWKICHLGDLGHPLSQSQVKHIGDIDVLLLPVGGGDRVLDPEKAKKTADTLKAKLIFPMHYRGVSINETLCDVQNFLARMPNVESSAASQFECSSLPTEPTVIHLELPKGVEVGG